MQSTPVPIFHVPVVLPFHFSGDGVPPRFDTVPQGDGVGRGTATRSAITVLVVDDTASGRYALARGMRQLGFRVIEASNGRDALRLASRCSAVLLDVRLPDMLGTEVCRRLRANPGTTALPVVHVSSVGPAAHAIDMAEFDHADAYLVGPVHPESAAALIEDLLRRRATPD